MIAGTGEVRFLGRVKRARSESKGGWASANPSNTSKFKGIQPLTYEVCEVNSRPSMQRITVFKIQLRFNHCCSQITAALKFYSTHERYLWSVSHESQIAHLCYTEHYIELESSEPNQKNTHFLRKICSWKILSAYIKKLSYPTFQWANLHLFLKWRKQIRRRTTG